MQITSKAACCPEKECPGHREMITPRAEEMSIAPPFWTVSWDLFAWMGHRRFARHWSVPQIRAELADTFSISVSDDLIEDYTTKYEVMVAARQADMDLLIAQYEQEEDLVLSIDGLQPEKGHECLYVVRELNQRRVWFAEPLLSSAGDEVRRLFERAKGIAERIGKPVRCWISDKQQAFVSGVAAVFPGVPHRYCANHFLRDVAKPVLEADSHAKVKMRRKVRGLRNIERRMLPNAGAQETTQASKSAPKVILSEIGSRAPASQEVNASNVKRFEPTSSHHCHSQPAVVPRQDASTAEEAAEPRGSAQETTLASGATPTAMMSEMDLCAPVPQQSTISGRKKVEPMSSEPCQSQSANASPGQPRSSTASDAEAREVVLDYCAAVRGILNDNRGGPLRPPGLRMAEALKAVQESLGRATAEKKGGPVNAL